MASICMKQLAIISMQVLMTSHCEADYACGIGGGGEGEGLYVTSIVHCMQI